MSLSAVSEHSVEPPPMGHESGGGSAAPAIAGIKRRRATPRDTNRVVKRPKAERSSAKRLGKAHHPGSVEKMRLDEKRKQMRTLVEQQKEEQEQRRAAERERIKRRRAQREFNALRNAKVQKLTNKATIGKLSKKQKREMAKHDVMLKEKVGLAAPKPSLSEA